MDSPDGQEVRDWTGRFVGSALSRHRPTTTAEVAEVVRSTAQRGNGIHTVGGNTSLVGGATPTGRRPVELLDTTRLTRIGSVDPRFGQVTVGAGVTLADLQSHARAAGWEYGVDLAARDSATVGGTLATNAGGMRVIRYGMTRAQVLGVRVVLADGSVLDDTSGLVKDNTGYDLSQLFVGAEGTLGVITAARLRLHPPLAATSTALCWVPDLDTALDLVAAVRAGGADLVAAEAFDHVSAGLIGADDDRGGWHLLLEVADGGTLDGLAGLPDHLDVQVALDEPDRRRLWQRREGLTEAYSVAATRDGHRVWKLDVSLPAGRMDEFAERVRVLAADCRVGRFGMFGHVADGNLHLETIAEASPAARFEGEALRLVADLGGSVSAEHGIGQAKREYLDLSRSPTEIRTMRQIKQALDPDGVLNPGILLPAEPRHR